MTAVTEVTICEECGDKIEPPESGVKMARLDGHAGDSDGRHLVFTFHVGCAPDELVGVWKRVT